MYQAQIDAGVAVLTEYFEDESWVLRVPTDHRLALNLPWVNAISGSGCVLAHLFDGDYYRGLEVLAGMSLYLDEWAIAHGFSGDCRVDPDFAQLTQEWRERLTAMRELDSEPNPA